MKWAFIDYENIGGLHNVDLSTYSKAFIFLGEKQTNIDFGSTSYVPSIEIVLVPIKDIQTKHLDFHLPYYLDKYESEAPKDIEFDVISNDKEFTPLIEHIKENGRTCSQIIIESVCKHAIAHPKNRLITGLTSRPKEERPQKIVNLKNFIASHMGVQGNEVAIQNFINQLLNKKVIAVSGNNVKYNC